MDAKRDLLRGEQVLVVLERPHLLGGADELLATDQRVIFSTPRYFKDVAAAHVASMGVYTRAEGKWFLRSAFAGVAAFFTYAGSAFLPQAAGGLDLTDVLRFLNFLGTTFLVLCALLLLVGALTIRRGLFIHYAGGHIRFPLRRADLPAAEQFIKAVRAGSRGGIVDAPRAPHRRGGKPPKPEAGEAPPRPELPPFDPMGIGDD